MNLRKATYELLILFLVVLALAIIWATLTNEPVGLVGWAKGIFEQDLALWR